MVAAELPVAEPAGYRMDDYKSAVPMTLSGARVVTTEEAAALWEKKRAVFFDVMPHIFKPDKLPAGTLWRDKVRKDIPGSTQADDEEFLQAAIYARDTYFGFVAV